jgi:hypothetical protein
VQATQTDPNEKNNADAEGVVPRAIFAFKLSSF